MSKEITVFSKDEFGEVRSVIINDEPWFIGKDVAKALKYSNPQKAIRDHVDEDDKGMNESFTPEGGTQKTIVINESGVYSLILRSRKEEAKAFKRWITSEVLPSIRKTGSYSISPSQQIIREKEARLRLKEENKQKEISLKYLDRAMRVLKDENDRRTIACEIVTIAVGHPVLPLKNGQTFSAEEIGRQLGISANMVGRIANANNLKTPRFGIFRTSVVNGTERQYFEYYRTVISEIEKHLDKRKDK